MPQMLTKGTVACACGKSWKYETLGEFVICPFCKKKHAAKGERVEWVPESAGDAEDPEI